ncbi:LOW QUALITY PROTEIN: hypothetical protein N5P37_006842 [Trichoderma harzianum]|nr:LOW QUALITY PROTEIN: hypothetical protein N5P37_006842 [Trichoderma harzianum]
MSLGGFLARHMSVSGGMIDDACLQGPPSQCVLAANWTIRGGVCFVKDGGRSRIGRSQVSNSYADAVRQAGRCVPPLFIIVSTMTLTEKTPNPSHGNTQNKAILRYGDVRTHHRAD